MSENQGGSDGAPRVAYILGGFALPPSMTLRSSARLSLRITQTPLFGSTAWGRPRRRPDPFSR